MFVSLFAMLVSRRRVVLGIFMLAARMVMFGLMVMMRCCVMMSGGIVMMLLRGMLRRLCHLWFLRVLMEFSNQLSHRFFVPIGGNQLK
jgi:hypothetical protein